MPEAALRTLGALLAVFGAVAVVFGLVGVLFGVGGVQDGGVATNSLDSELRYFAAWYAASGVLSLWAARDPVGRHVVVRVTAAALLVGAGGRLVAMVDRGRPHGVFVFLTGVEIVVGVALLGLLAASARAQDEVGQ